MFVVRTMVVSGDSRGRTQIVVLRLPPRPLSAASDRNTSDDPVIQCGCFKGKKIEIASTAGVDLVRDVAEYFMREIFRMEPEDYLISDESSLSDFVGSGDETLGAIQARVHRVYALDVSGIPQGNLLGLFVRIRGFQ